MAADKASELIEEAERLKANARGGIVKDTKKIAKLSAQKKDVIPPRMTYRELMTVWAGLRLFQSVESLKNGEPTDSVETTWTGIAESEYFEETTPLTSKEIDRLCLRLTAGPHNVDPRKEALLKAHNALRRVGGLQQDPNVRELTVAARNLIEAFRKNYE